MKNKIKRLGFLLPDLAPAQLPYQIITSGNALLKTTDKYDLCLFYRNFSIQCSRANFATMGAFEAFSYSGIMVVTDLYSASVAVKWPGPNRSGKIFFYVNDLEWIRMRASTSFESFFSVYNHPKIELIARSDEHARIIRSIWREPIGVVENANVSDFVKLIWGENNDDS